MAAVNKTATKNAPVLLDEVKFEEALRNYLVKIVKNLVENKAFEFINGRTYKDFTNVKSSMLEDFSVSEMFKWIDQHRKNVYLNRCSR